MTEPKKQQPEGNISGLRKQFFAYRNGIVAQKLRQAGDPHTSIMGCLLADISSVVSHIPNQCDRAQLAQELWQHTESRECRLAAPMIMPHASMPISMAQLWCQSVETTEVADVLCHRLLRHLPYACYLCKELVHDEHTLVQYTGYRLMLNLLLMGTLCSSPSLEAFVKAQLSQADMPFKALLHDIADEL